MLIDEQVWPSAVFLVVRGEVMISRSTDKICNYTMSQMGYNRAKEHLIRKACKKTRISMHKSAIGETVGEEVMFERSLDHPYRAKAIGNGVCVIKIPVKLLSAFPAKAMVEMQEMYFQKRDLKLSAMRNYFDLNVKDPEKTKKDDFNANKSKNYVIRTHRLSFQENSYSERQKVCPLTHFSMEKERLSQTLDKCKMLTTKRVNYDRISLFRDAYKQYCRVKQKTEVGLLKEEQQKSQIFPNQNSRESTCQKRFLDIFRPQISNQTAERSFFKIIKK